MSENKTQVIYEKKSFFEKVGKEIVEAAYEYANGYMRFLDIAKTEREAVEESVRMAEAAGYSAYSFGMPLKAGDKLYYNNRGKNIFLFKIGTEPINNGIRITGAHIDSPRLDLKQSPVYEEADMCYLKTHYYGGIRKYQWLTLPLALHGVVVRKTEKLSILQSEKRRAIPFSTLQIFFPTLLPRRAQKRFLRHSRAKNSIFWLAAVPMRAWKRMP